MPRIRPRTLGEDFKFFFLVYTLVSDNAMVRVTVCQRALMIYCLACFLPELYVVLETIDALTAMYLSII